MKKGVYFILIISILLGLSACNVEPTPPKGPSVLLSTLSEYTIVYPENYSEWKMTEVRLLAEVIKNVTGTEIKYVSDTENIEGKKIILGSSSVENKYSEEIAGFANAMCYVIGVDGDNIVLGGKNYYSDMRAIYDFINNYIGYDDINNVYGEIKKEVSGSLYVSWTKPDFYIMGSNFSCYGPKEAYQIKDFVDCGFNLFQFTSSMLTDDKEFSLKNGLKYCARFGIEGLYMPSIDATNSTIILPDEEDIVENPAMWGFYVGDEPADETVYKKYHDAIVAGKDKYSGLGWKFYVNLVGYVQPNYDMDDRQYNYEDYLSLDSDAVSMDTYLYGLADRTCFPCYSWEYWKKNAVKFDQDYYTYVESYDIKSRKTNPSKMFRMYSYLGFAFDVKMLEYFQYGDASILYTSEGDWTEGALVNWDFTKNPAWYDAQITNREVMKTAKILSLYEWQGAFSFGPKDDAITYMDDPYWKADDYLDIVENTSKATGVFGCFNKKDDNKKKAVALCCLDELDNEKYDISKPGKNFITVKFGCENVTCYRGGEQFELKANDDGTYNLPFDNGDCYLFTME